MNYSVLLCSETHLLDIGWLIGTACLVGKCNGWCSLLTWKDLEAPRRFISHTSRHICKRVAKKDKMKEQDKFWMWVAPSHGLEAMM